MKDIFTKPMGYKFTLNGKPAKASAEFERCCTESYNFMCDCVNKGIIDAWNKLSDIGNIDANIEDYYTEGYDTICSVIATKKLQELTNRKSIGFDREVMSINPKEGNIYFHLVTVKKE